MDEFYKRLRAMMQDKGVTITDLAEDLGLPYSTVQPWFVKKSRLPADVLCAIADRFSVSVEYLATGKSTVHAPRTVADAICMLNAVLDVFGPTRAYQLGSQVRIEFESPTLYDWFGLQSKARSLINNGIPENLVQMVIDAKMQEFENTPINGGAADASQEG